MVGADTRLSVVHLREPSDDMNGAGLTMCAAIFTTPPIWAVSRLESAGPRRNHYESAALNPPQSGARQTASQESIHVLSSTRGTQTYGSRRRPPGAVGRSGGGGAR